MLHRGARTTSGTRGICPLLPGCWTALGQAVQPMHSILRVRQPIPYLISQSVPSVICFTPMAVLLATTEQTGSQHTSISALVCADMLSAGWYDNVPQQCLCLGSCVYT